MSLLRAAIGPTGQLWPFGDAQSPNDVRLLHTIPPYEARPVDEDTFEYSIEDGLLDVEWKHGSQTLSADACHVEYEGPSHLCNACLSALGYLAHNLKDCIVHEGDENFQTKESVVQHQNLMALFAAANKGCQLCKTIWSRRFKTNHITAGNVRIDFCWNTTQKVSWDGRRPGDARLVCNLVSTTAQNHNKDTWDTIFRFQLWPSPTFDPFFKVEGSVPPDPIDRSNTRSSRPMALQWLSECNANVGGEHSGCQGSDASWYPTRLLDLSKLEETGRVFLVVTCHLDHSSMDQSEYVTLSHCWGAWGAKELPVLTESNINERVEHGMDLSSFPPTFRDAIEVASWFNSE